MYDILMQHDGGPAARKGHPVGGQQTGHVQEETQGSHTQQEGSHTQQEGSHTQQEGSHTQQQGSHTQQEGSHTQQGQPEMTMHEATVNTTVSSDANQGSIAGATHHQVPAADAGTAAHDPLTVSHQVNNTAHDVAHAAQTAGQTVGESDIPVIDNTLGSDTVQSETGVTDAPSDPAVANSTVTTNSTDAPDTAVKPTDTAAHNSEGIQPTGVQEPPAVTHQDSEQHHGEHHTTNIPHVHHSTVCDNRHSEGWGLIIIIASLCMFEQALLNTHIAHRINTYPQHEHIHHAATGTAAAQPDSTNEQPSQESAVQLHHDHAAADTNAVNAVNAATNETTLESVNATTADAGSSVEHADTAVNTTAMSVSTETTEQSSDQPTDQPPAAEETHAQNTQTNAETHVDASNAVDEPQEQQVCPGCASCCARRSHIITLFTTLINPYTYTGCTAQTRIATSWRGIQPGAPAAGVIHTKGHEPRPASGIVIAGHFFWCGRVGHALSTVTACGCHSI